MELLVLRLKEVEGLVLDETLEARAPHLDVGIHLHVQGRIPTIIFTMPEVLVGDSLHP